MYFRDALLKHRSYNYTPETTVVTTTLVRVRATKRVCTAENWAVNLLTSMYELKIKPVYRDRYFRPTRLNLGKSWYFGMNAVTTSHIRITRVLLKPI